MATVLNSLRQLLFPGTTRKPIPALDGAYSPNNTLDALPILSSDIVDVDDVCAFGDGLLAASGARLIHIGMDGANRGDFARFEHNISALSESGNGHIIVALEGTGLKIIDSEANIIAELTDATFNRACITALCPHADGSIYFTIGSQQHAASDWVWDLMQANSSGELWRWHPDSGETERLLQGLAYPNGLCQESGGQSLLITQAWSHQLTRLCLGTGTPGKRLANVIENLPGYPARIAPAANDGYWLALFAMRTQLVEMVLRDTPFKKEMMRCVEPQYWVRPALRATGSHLEPLQGGGIKKLGIKKPWAPPRAYGLVLQLDSDAVPQHSMHSRVDGQRHGITAAREIHGQTLIVSKGSNTILNAGAEANE